MYSETEKIEAV